MTWSVLAILAIVAAASCDSIVNTHKGYLKGKTLTSREGRAFYSYTGIPYAKPPVGDLRFKSPEPVDPWNFTLDATKESTICIQKNHFIESIKHFLLGEEDCLHLNVFTPDLSGKLPVMVWIHGGGFAAGHSGTSLYGPEYFMDKDVVFVSFNYRLGLLGFLSTEDEAIPGNFGLKDQVMALRWVQENIADFGGDPTSVTIFGESAGGASTGYHLLSPMSKGLFHKAILQSGVPLCRWATSVPGLARKRAEAVATMAGCLFSSSEDILKCLKALPANTFGDLYQKFFEWDIHPCIVFNPVVESCNSDEAFLCRHPLTDFKQESHVPTIIGINSGEGGIFISSWYNSTSLMYPELQTDFNRLMPSILAYKHFAKPEHLDKISETVLKHYMPAGRLDDHSYLNAVDMVGDGTFVSAVIDMSLKLSSPVYLYLFDYQNQFSFNRLYGKCDKSLGVTHGDEMINLFKMPEVLPKGLNDRDTEISKLMINIWTKFAKSGNPTVDGEDDGPAWPQFTSLEHSLLLHVNSPKPTTKQNPFVEKYRFWKELPLLSHLDHVMSQKQFSMSQSSKNEL
ncbi:juvenile hormone esterase-like [Adelges cooleyi]|uniref:juvenile hormone esterase-like n=1 Tax=Adelges cooleyi TaxID=133065 RepID=UPI00217FDD73|nr:juvenile hormone esterase-like [Adelges cooleyi]